MYVLCDVRILVWTFLFFVPANASTKSDSGELVQIVHLMFVLLTDVNAFSNSGSFEQENKISESGSLNILKYFFGLLFIVFGLDDYSKCVDYRFLMNEDWHDWYQKWSKNTIVVTPTVFKVHFQEYAGLIDLEQCLNVKHLPSLTVEDFYTVKQYDEKYLKAQKVCLNDDQPMIQYFVCLFFVSVEWQSYL